MTSAVLTRQRHWLMPLNAVLAVVCLVLFLLAVEQRQALDAWQAVRTGAVSMVERTGGWTDAAARTATRLASGRPVRVAPGLEDAVLEGRFALADLEAVGGIVFQHQDIRFESGAVLHTQPLRIMAAGDSRIDGQSLADRLNTVDEAQIEWRLVAAPKPEDAAVVAGLCGGEAPQRLALLHRTDTVDLLLFSTSDEPLGAMPAPCGVWSLRAP